MGDFSMETASGGLLQLTWEAGASDALFTARGKDHDLSAADLRVLAAQMMRAADDLDGGPSLLWVCGECKTAHSQLPEHGRCGRCFGVLRVLSIKTEGE